MTGTWPEGALQLLVAFGMLSQPLGAYVGTPERVVMLEYATGWVLVRPRGAMTLSVRSPRASPTSSSPARLISR